VSIDLERSSRPHGHDAPRSPVGIAGQTNGPIGLHLGTTFANSGHTTTARDIVQIVADSIEEVIDEVVANDHTLGHLAIDDLASTGPALIHDAVRMTAFIIPKRMFNLLVVGAFNAAEMNLR